MTPPGGDGSVTPPSGEVTVLPEGEPSSDDDVSPWVSDAVYDDGPLAGARCGADSEIRVITSQAQVDELSGCTEFLGALVIDPPAGVQLDLRRFGSLRRVGQDLALGCNPFHSSQGGECATTGVSSLTLDGLENLEEVASLTLGGLSVSSLAQLGKLRTVAAFLTIDRCNQLESLEGLEGAQIGSLHLLQNARLTSLKGLAASQLVAGIQISGMPGLTDLSALSPVTTLGFLHLLEIPLQNLDVLSNLTQLRSLFLIDMPALNDASGLRQLRELDELVVTRTALESLDALQLTELGSLALSENALLEDIDALQGVTRLESFRVSNNPSLSRLPTFERVTQLASVEILENEALLEGPGFPSVRDMTNGSLYVTSNPGLQHLDGFSSLETGGWIQIAANDRLESVAFPRLESAFGLRVTCNPALPDASLAALSQISTLSGTQLYNQDAGQCPQP